jgi:hypothetical protein
MAAEATVIARVTARASLVFFFGFHDPRVRRRLDAHDGKAGKAGSSPANPAGHF